MKELTANKAWALIAEIGWGSRTTDYNHIAETYFKLLGEKKMTQLASFVGARVSDLGKAVEKFEEDNRFDNVSLEVGSDDGFSDLRYHVVGLGKFAFEQAMEDPKLLQVRSRSGQYTESFAYCFSQPDPPRTEENKLRSRELLVKNVAALEKQLREIEFELSTVRGQFSAVNFLLNQVLEDTKKSA